MQKVVLILSLILKMTSCIFFNDTVKCNGLWSRLVRSIGSFNDYGQVLRNDEASNLAAGHRLFERCLEDLRWPCELDLRP